MSDFPQKKTWITLQTFTEDGSNLAVEVQTSNDARPILSWRDGRMHEGRFVHGHRPRGRVENGVFVLERIDMNVLGRLVGRALDFIQERRQQEEAEFQSTRRKPGGNHPKPRGSNGQHSKGRDGSWDFER